VSIVGFAGDVGYVAVPAAVALETIGVPVPAETTLVAAAVLAAQGRLNIAIVISLASAAAIVGDNIGYLLGRRLGRRVLLAPGPLARQRRRLVETGDRFFAAHGAAAVFLGRWVAVGRIAAAWLAGADRMRWRTFAIWNAAGGVAWATSVGLVAYGLGSAGARWLAIAGAVVAIATLARMSGLPRWRPRVRAPRLGTRRQVIAVLGLGAAATGFVVFVLPEIAGAGAAWRRVRQGDPAWLFAAGLAEILSYAGYVALLRIVFRGTVRWRESFLITMAGVAATRLLATAGAGGIALTSWALRRLGLPARAVGQGLVAFMVVLYAVYMAALLVLGVGLGTGVLAGGGSPLLTLLPATLAAGLIALALTMARAPGRIEQRLASLAAGEGRMRRPPTWLGELLDGAGEGVRFAIALVSRRPATLLAAVAWWGFDIAAVAAGFHAFGSTPEVTVLVLGYFVGMLGNLLPLPGGVGGVEGGMIGAYVAFGEPAGVALVAVLAYRLVSFWLPTVVGGPAYVALRRTLGSRPE
jgi:putative heme transporter